MAKYRKKEDCIQAVQWNGVQSLVELDKMMGGDWVFTVDRDTLKIHTTSDSGPLVVSQSDYVVTDGRTVSIVSQGKFNEMYVLEYPLACIDVDDWSMRNPFSIKPVPLTGVCPSKTTIKTDFSEPLTLSTKGVLNTIKFECDDCLDVSKETETFAQKSACHCCNNKIGG